MDQLVSRLYDAERYRRQARWGRILYRFFGAHPLTLGARLLYHWRVEGGEYIPKSGPCVLAMNHVGGIADALTTIEVRRRRPDVLILAWQHLADTAPIRDFLLALGDPTGAERLLPVIKGRGLSSFTLYRAYKALQTGGAVLVTVEGGVTWDGRLQHPLEPGAAWLGLRNGAPVIPLRSIGGYDVQPLWQFDRIRLSGRITLRVGPPLSLADAPLPRVSDAALAAASDRIYQALLVLAPDS